MAIVRVMLEGITRADQALGALTDALRESDEPTIVVFFGDHRPNLFMTDGDTVYTKLGLCPANDTVDWTAEQINDLYATDYLIWANDAALLQGQAGTERESSITAIGPQLLELTGQPVSRYLALLEKVSQVCLTNTELYFVDGAGDPSTSAETADLSDEARELLSLRDDVLYDAMYGQQYITAAMNEPAPVKDRKAKERTESAAGFCPRRSVLHKNGRAVENRSGPSGQRSASRSSLQARSSSFAGRP